MLRLTASTRVLAACLAAAVLSLAGCDRGADSGEGGTPPSPASSTPGDGLGEVQFGSVVTPDGRERTYRLYIAATARPNLPVPLLVAMHGGGGSGEQFERTSGFDAVADQRGWLVAYPDGVGGPGTADRLRTWNGGTGYCCGAAERDDVDDVEYIRLLVQQISSERPVDPLRTYAAGHSNGGIMAYRLACELSDVIVAVGLQAGSLGVDPCAPPRPVSLLHLHGTADRNHPIDGGVGPSGISGVDFNPAIDGVRTLAAADGCPSSPRAEVDAANPDVTRAIWSPCLDGSAVEFVTVAGASHAWMGREPERASLVGEAYLQLDASVVIGDFLAAHPRR